MASIFTVHCQFVGGWPAATSSDRLLHCLPSLPANSIKGKNASCDVQIIEEGHRADIMLLVAGINISVPGKQKQAILRPFYNYYTGNCKSLAQIFDLHRQVTVNYPERQ